MTREPSIGGTQVADLLEALRRFGVAPVALCRAAGIDASRLRTPILLSDPATRMPARLVVALFAEAERRTGDPLVGLHVGNKAEPRGPLAYLIMSSPRLADGLRHARRFGMLSIDTLRIDVALHADTASLVIDLGHPALEASRHLVDYMMMASLRSLRRSFGGALDLREAHVRHRDPGGAAEAARTFGCPVRFEQRANRLLVGAEALQARSRLANPFIAAQIEKFAAALAAQLGAVTLRERVAGVTRALLASGVRADRDTVARRLQVSRRTMQRGLEAERTSFKAVRDAVLWEAVQALVSNPSLRVKEVALSVGFRDVAAFSKAFKRWAGRSPTAYRLRPPRAARRPRARSTMGGRGRVATGRTGGRPAAGRRGRGALRE